MIPYKMPKWMLHKQHNDLAHSRNQCHWLDLRQQKVFQIIFHKLMILFFFVALYMMSQIPFVVLDWRGVSKILGCKTYQSLFQ